MRPKKFTVAVWNCSRVWEKRNSAADQHRNKNALVTKHFPLPRWGEDEGGASAFPSRIRLIWLIRPYLAACWCLSPRRMTGAHQHAVAKHKNMARYHQGFANFINPFLQNKKDPPECVFASIGSCRKGCDVGRNHLGSKLMIAANAPRVLLKGIITVIIQSGCSLWTSYLRRWIASSRKGPLAFFRRRW